MAADVLITVDLLPWEVIECILENDNLEIWDLFNFGLTCKYLFKAVIGSNKIWRRKFFQRYNNIQYYTITFNYLYLLLLLSLFIYISICTKLMS